MAGGIGSRFWPVSTQKFPKQFHDMLGTGESLLQKTFSRLEKIVPASNILILTNERYLDLTLQQLPKISEKQVVLEPAMRNTAPCILLSALKIQKEDPDAVMLVAPSDHWIEDENSFKEDLEICFKNCENEDVLMTLGIPPTFPNTGYGYIECDANATSEIKKVNQFREKPDYETAKHFLSQGNYLWNAGIFLWSVKSIISAFEAHLPVMNALFSEGKPIYNTEGEEQFVAQNYGLAENISIDYGIMEKAKNVYVKEATFDWNDLGTWGALHDKLVKDINSNAIVRATTHLKEASGNMIFSEKDKLIVIDGLTDYIVVDKEDVMLIFPKEKEQEIKILLAEVANKHGKKYS
ncbi:mannose-1-phosphate guanylyltransferase [Marinirhabdus gelatinilytica]|nr:mannose-1-phosphate guanylyltransferase [Marinirhabdus gelatinilytica]